MRKLLLAWILGIGLAFPPPVVAAPVMEAAGIAASELSERALRASRDLVDYALSLVGVKYRFGGKDPDSGLDCSGFVGYVFRQSANLPLPSNAYSISRVGKRVGRDELQPGDLVFFKTLRRSFSHVGIYAGERMFIHASSRRDKQITVSNLDDSYWARRFEGGRRVIAADSPASPE
jgi:cell wall-associated NlpC family hydrolase